MKQIENLDKDTLITIRTDLDCTPLDNELVMMDLDKGKYYSLNSVGSSIWNMLKTPMTLSDLVTSLTKEFDIDYNKCCLEVTEFLNRLYDSELITLN